MSRIFDEMFSFENLDKAFQQSLKEGGKYKEEALFFQRNETANLMSLRDSLYDRSYTFSGYHEFNVYEPKERVINAPHYIDKIVQLAMGNVLNEIFMPTFINESYACMVDRGTHKAVEKVQQNLRKAKREYGEDAYICKFDVQKFFYSIDREVLKVIYRKKIKDEDVLWIMDLITDSGSLIDELGVPLGNSMSQLYANVYLDQLDQYCKRYLGYKYYVRYADDVIIVLPSKLEAQKAKNECIKFVREQLNMEESKEKTQVYPIKQGVNAYGFKIHPTHRLLRNDSKKKIKRKIKKMPASIARGSMSIETANTMLGSWSGHARYADSMNFVHGILNRRTYIMVEDKTLKINEEELLLYIEKTKSLN